MHKALTQMNLQIQHVISDLTGTTGLAIVDAILAGERDPAVLAQLRDPRIRATAETIQKSLVGNWTTGALVRASTVPPALPDLSTTNRLLRSGNREAVKRLRTTC